jgi:hypothetical protein
VEVKVAAEAKAASGDLAVDAAVLVVVVAVPPAVVGLAMTLLAKRVRLPMRPLLLAKPIL